jgi:hypothetical protein
MIGPGRSGELGKHRKPVPPSKGSRWKKPSTCIWWIDPKRPRMPTAPPMNTGTFCGTGANGNRVSSRWRNKKRFPIWIRSRLGTCTPELMVEQLALPGEILFPAGSQCSGEGKRMVRGVERWRGGRVVVFFLIQSPPTPVAAVWKMNTSALSLKRAQSFRICSTVRSRCPERNMLTALCEPNSGIKLRWVRFPCSIKCRTTETGLALGMG